MKRGIYVMLVAGLLLGVSASVASAQSATGTKAKEERAAIKAEVKSVLTETKQAAINQYASNMINVFQKVLDRQQNLGIRLASLIQKYQSQGVDMSAASAKLAEGQELYESASVAVQGLPAEIEKVIAAQKPKTAFAATKKIIKATASDIKELHAVIVETIKLIRGAKPAEAQATTTTTIPVQPE